MASADTLTEGEILERIVAKGQVALSAGAARSLLELRFPARETARIRSLLRRNNSGTITANERIALDKYLRIGQLLDLIHARARLALANRSPAK